MPAIHIKNAYILTMNAEREIFDGGDILIEDGTIRAAGFLDPQSIPEDAEVVDACGRIVMPGLVNTHVHLSQQLGRGLGDDVDLITWLHERTWPYERSLTAEDNLVSAQACCLEMIRSGVTCFAEPGGQHVDTMGRAVEEAGIRGILARSTMDCGEGIPENERESTDQCLDRQLEHMENWHGKADGRISVWFGLRTIFNNSDELLTRTKELADSRGVGMHMHVAEVREEIDYTKTQRGAPTVEHLNRLGVLGPNLLAVHTVWITPREMDLFRLHDVKVSHCPGAAMKVLGFAPVPEMLERGICVSIGTDGAPCNNRMDMFDEMYLTAMIHKGRTLAPTAVPAERVLEMATIKGAEALLMGGVTGSLEPGKAADLIMIDMRRHPGSVPVHDAVANLVYAMRSSCVDSVMCTGKWVMQDRTVLTLDEQGILEEAQERAEHIRKRAGIALPERFPVRTR
ncbi:amidohydrolase [Salidesulfovibrio brasiliensis]|uniref:amidohydrolase n=1 Tax=Salidesulfovibrio brasiliensis TaxID=221711 RepID=UPI0006D2279A|nr:amidohydrolase [Salidesulfovibrio brasiliensis]